MTLKLNFHFYFGQYDAKIKMYYRVWFTQNLIVATIFCFWQPITSLMLFNSQTSKTFLEMFIVFYPFYIGLDCVCFISQQNFLFTKHNQYFIFFIILQMNTFSYAPIYLKSTINFLYFSVRMNVNCFAVDFIMTTILDFVSVFQPSFFSSLFSCLCTTHIPIQRTCQIQFLHAKSVWMYACVCAYVCACTVYSTNHIQLHANTEYSLNLCDCMTSVGFSNWW